MRVVIVLCSIIAVISGASINQQRIVGSSVTTIDQYPSIVAVLARWSPSLFVHRCGGIILNFRSILTAAQCVYRDTPLDLRARAGSSFVNKGGYVYGISQITVHQDFHRPTFENDLAILRTSTNIAFTELVQPGRFAGAYYTLADNQPVWAAGWSCTNFGGPSEQLRHVQMYTVNQEVCRAGYSASGNIVSDNMVCAAEVEVASRPLCHGDVGGPLYHNGNVVGVVSWGLQHGLRRFPVVNMRLTQFSFWIRDHA